MPTIRATSATKSLLTVVTRIAIMLVPAVFLGVGALRSTDGPQVVLALGAAFQVVVCVFSFLSTRSWRQPIAPSVITLYLISLGWFWLSGVPDDWYQHFGQAMLLTVPLAVFAFQALTNSGAPARRRARVLAERLGKRKDWPADIADCRNLPEVKALREALHQDATPALHLLFCPIPSAQVAVLSALEFHKNWKPGQAELVLGVAQRAREPAIRAAAVSALANVDDRLLVEGLAVFLRDPSREVRRAATEALLWESGGQRWGWIRLAVRHSLADPLLEGDGPLYCEGQQLPADAIDDLHGWASQKGILAVRAVQTLGKHYRKLLNEQSDDRLLEDLQQQLASPRTAPALRIELAHLLRTHGQWTEEQLARLLDPANPAPLRLIAAETILSKGNDDRAVAALYDVAQLPNREIALATAEVVQRCLGVDLGLPLGQPLPALHTRQAAEITRRVMLWASKQDSSAPNLARMEGERQTKIQHVVAP
jgi:hypothetical protein